MFEEFAEVSSFSLKGWSEKAVLYSELLRVEMQVFHLGDKNNVSLVYIKITP